MQNILNIYYFSIESFSFGREASWSEITSVVDNTCWFMALISWKSNALIFNNVLLNDGISDRFTFRLADSFLVYINVGYETIVAWNMMGNL